MFTVCPRCALPLAVTVADLRAGQGYVRCGRCANVFNALLALAEESGPAAPAPGTAPTRFVDMDTASATVSRPALQEVEITAERPELPEESLAAPAAAPRAVQSSPAPESAPQSAPAPAPPPEPAPAPAPAPLAAGAPPALRLIDNPPQPPPPLFVTEAYSGGAGATLATATANQPDVDLDTTGEYSGTSTFETIILEGDTFLQTEETIPEEVMASELADVSRRIAARSGDDDDGDRRRFVARGRDGFAGPDAGDADVVELRDEQLEPALDEEAEAQDEFEALYDQDEEDGISAELEALREATGEFRHEANLGVAPGEGTRAFRRPSLRPGWRATTVAVLLALLLAGQAINHWRDELATHAGWYGPMQGLAALLGEPLRPNWDLNAYDVRQLGATPDGPDNHALRVRLRLANIGVRAQALPLLRLTLIDRYGKAVSQGELQPAQYLPRELHSLQFIARDQRIDTEVRVQDPTQQASSFELDVCVPATGGLRCAGDTPTIAGHS
jgi:predicted Zn finger-like uncharacterized protein